MPPAGRPVKLNPLASPSRLQTFAYDAAGRLISYSDPGNAIGYGYDTNGNRTSRVANGQSSTNTYPPSSNRMLTAAGQSIATDAAGNILSDGQRTLGYDAAGRLVSASRGFASASYQYDGLGERSRKVSGSLTRHYVYDQAGHLIGEYDASGAAVVEYAWLGDFPVALRRYSGGVAETFAIESDQLGTPRVITDSQQRLRWRWASAPFGNSPPEEDPSGAGALTFNLRFPGQYYDDETGLHYNYFRDYDPGTGRYVESDPIGLAGGINTYAYVDGNPLAKTDPTGEFGVAGAAGAAAFNFFTQFGTNLYLTNGDWRRALRCVDFGDVLISGALGFIGPSFISNVLGGKAGPAGLTAAQNRYLYFAKSLPSGFALKKGSPPLRIADDCECQGLNLGAVLSAIAH